MHLRTEPILVLLFLLLVFSFIDAAPNFQTLRTTSRALYNPKVGGLDPVTNKASAAAVTTFGKTELRLASSQSAQQREINDDDDDDGDPGVHHWCACLKSLANPKRCCSCQRAKCKCWHSWWKGQKYKTHICRWRCRHRCWGSLGM